MNFMQHQHAGSTNIDIGLFNYLARHSNFKTILDVGCGPGGNVNYCNKLGYEAFGIDGDEKTLPKGPNFQIVDYRTQSSSFKGPFDLCWSVEFAEHIEEKYISNFTKDFQKCRHLIFTAAPPGWGGTSHLNEQNEEYWIKTLGEYDFILDIKKTNIIRKISLLEFDNRIRIPRKQFVQNRGLFFNNLNKI